MFITVKCSSVDLSHGLFKIIVIELLIYPNNKLAVMLTTILGKIYVSTLTGIKLQS